MIIGFAGQKESGKTTAAKVLLENGFKPISFASTLKQMLHILLCDLGLGPDEIIYHTREKESVIPKCGVSYRQIAQTLGTEWGRDHVNRDLWVMCARRKLSMRSGSVVFDDVRFENESHMIRAAGGVIVHLRRPDLTSDDNHPSEQRLIVNFADKIIVADSVEALRARVLELIP